MCIIVCKPQGVEMPSIDTLQNCFTNNPDGAGFMWADGKRVHISKGFFTFDDFFDAVAMIPDDMAIVMHFRIATHGGISEGTCHPFPVTDNMDKMILTECDDRICVAHNGVISGMDDGKGVSDTMAFIRDYLAPLRRLCPDMLHSSDALAIAGKVAGSKLAFMDNSGEVVTCGEFMEKDGVLYSNTSFLKRTYSYSSYADWWKQWTDDSEDENAVEVSDAMQELIDNLPFDYCKDCPERFDCVTYEPYCVTKEDNDYIREYYEDKEVDTFTPSLWDTDYVI